MFARFGREEKVGATLIRADPRAIQPHFRQRDPGMPATARLTKTRSGKSLRSTLEVATQCILPLRHAYTAGVEALG
jgi:hypothetical protein